MAEQTPESEPTMPSAPDEGAAPSENVIDSMTEDALQSAASAAAALSAEMGGSAEPGELELPDFDADGAEPDTTSGLGMLSDVDLRVKIELGRTRMYVADVLRLRPDSVVELDKAAGDPVNIYVNDRHLARGEVLVVDDNLCVRISEIIAPEGGDA